MRVQLGAAVPGVVLGAGEDAVLLAPAHPNGGVLAHGLRIGAKRAGPHDRVLRLEIEVAHGRERPVDSHGPGFLRRDDGGRVGGVEVAERAEGRGRRHLGQALDLLGGPALQVRADEQRPARLFPHSAGQLHDRVPRTAEDDEPADPHGQRGVDGGALVREAAAPPAQRRKNQPRERRGHAGVTWPRMRGPRAPVAAGRLPGRAFTVSQPRNANATASLASPSKNR